MAAGIIRSFQIVALSFIVAFGAQGVYARWLCSPHQAWVRARTGRSAIMLKHSYGVPRSGDVIFACELPHRIGPLTLYTDLICYCGPSTTSQEAISALVGGSCEVDTPTQGGGPTFCTPAYCDEHVGP